jgi:Ser/Thr protein kinase RdoA (MazF antagonist)
VDTPLPALIGAARRVQARRATPEDRRLLDAHGFRRIRGASNWLCALSVGSGRCCLKLFGAANARERARREWRALSLLAERGYAHAPRPVCFGEDARSPVVVAEFLDGRPIRKERLTRRKLTALAEALGGMHRVRPSPATDDGLPELGGAAAVAPWLRDELPRLAVTRTDAGTEEARTLAEEWLASGAPDLLREPAQLVFSRADANFANCLWDGRRIVVVDYEYSGWRDRASDLADLLEVDGAWSILAGFERTSEDDWAWFVGQFDLSGPERRRLLAARRCPAPYGSQ